MERKIRIVEEKTEKTLVQRERTGKVILSRSGIVVIPDDDVSLEEARESLRIETPFTMADAPWLAGKPAHKHQGSAVLPKNERYEEFVPVEEVNQASQNKKTKEEKDSLLKAGKKAILDTMSWFEDNPMIAGVILLLFIAAFLVGMLTMLILL